MYYRPTVHYAYHPCPDAILSLKELVQRKYIPQKEKRIILKEIVDGTDELGVLLMGIKKGLIGMALIYPYMRLES